MASKLKNRPPHCRTPEGFKSLRAARVSRGMRTSQFLPTLSSAQKHFLTQHWLFCATQSSKWPLQPAYTVRQNLRSFRKRRWQQQESLNLGRCQVATVMKQTDDSTVAGGLRVRRLHLSQLCPCSFSRVPATSPDDSALVICPKNDCSKQCNQDTHASQLGTCTT